MTVKVRIEVRDGNNNLLKVIFRKAWAEPFGNFCPVYCTYQHERCLVESDEPHLDDPLRFHLSDHLGHLFIRPRDFMGRLVPTWEELDADKTVYQCLIEDNRTSPTHYRLVHSAKTEQDAIKWLESHGGGTYRNTLHGFEMKVSPLATSEEE